MAMSKRKAEKITPGQVPPERGGEGVGDRVGVNQSVPSGVDVKALEVGVGKGILKGAGSALRLRRLDPKETAEAVFKHWPNLSRAAAQLGVTRQSLGWHKANSPWFQRIVAEADAKGCDALEQVLFDRGVSGEEYTFNDRIAYLRAHRPELYNPAKVIVLQDGRVPIKEATSRARLAGEAMDAEIVEGYKHRKALKAARVVRDAGGSPAGGEGGEA